MQTVDAKRWCNWLGRVAPSLAMALLLLLIGALPLSAQEGYTLKVGDELELDILDDSDPPQRFVIGSDGAVRLPLLGGLEVVNLTLEEARELIRVTYIAREIFVSPTVDLSIAAYRPVFVTGDVRNPGFYDFRPFISAEQALGLAGGPQVASSNAEARVLGRRALEGAQTATEADLTRFATEYARVQAQLRGGTEVLWGDIPDHIRPVIERESFAILKPAEDEIIRLEQQNYETQIRLLREAIEEIGSEIVLLREREVAQVAAMERAEADLIRGQELTERGVQSTGPLSQLHRLVSEAEDLLLQIRTQQTGARRRLGELQREYARLESDRRQRLLAEGQSLRSEIAKLEAARMSIIDRQDLLRQWIDSAAHTDLDGRIDYRVRRRGADAVETFVIDGLTELYPGDLLIVTIRVSETVARVEE